MSITDWDMEIYWIFGRHIEFWPPFLKFYSYITNEIGILDPDSLLIDILHYFLCQIQTETWKCLEFWPPYWILAAILNFHSHIIIRIEFLDPFNLLLDIFHHFLCQLQTEISDFIEAWRPFFILAAILFLSLDQLGHPSKMHTSDPNNNSG